MAAPSGTSWGSIVGSYGRIGIYTKITNTNTQTTVSVEVWFWSKYSVSDANNTLYYNRLSSSGSATTSRGSVSINTTVNSGDGWSTSNQKKIWSDSATYDRGTSAATRYLYAKLKDVDAVGGTMYASKTFSIPKLPSYTISYNANGGSGAPSSQVKWYGTTLKLSATKPTRTGYVFQGWGTSSTDTSVDYAAEANYTANAAVTLYAIWKANTWTVTYNANGGKFSGGSTTATDTKTYGVALTLDAVPTKTGYTFMGWDTSSSAKTVVYAQNGSYKTNAAITLYAVWSLSYTKPRITGLSIKRCNSGGTVSDDGTNALVKFNWACNSNVSSIVIRWKLTTETSYNNSFSVSVDTTKTSGSVSTIVGSNALSTDSTYNFYITVADTGGSYSRTSILPGAVYVIDLLQGGKGVAFGKAAEKENAVDMGFKALFRDGASFEKNNTSLYGLKPDGLTSREAFNPQNGNGNTIIGYGNYENRDGSTNTYGYDVALGVSNISGFPDDNGVFRPYRRRGDSITYLIRTTGYVINGGKDVYFRIVTTVPIIGSPTVTAVSGNGFVLMQNGQYTHGSTGSTYVSPDSYEATASMWGGISIKATFSNTTNAVNRETIGIYWSGTVTFS